MNYREAKKLQVGQLVLDTCCNTVCEVIEKTYQDDHEIYFKIKSIRGQMIFETIHTAIKFVN